MTAPRYRSTRSEETTYSLSEAVIRGIAPDGGLFVPTFIPEIVPASSAKAGFASVAQSLLSPFLSDEMLPSQIEHLCQDAFSFDVPIVSLDGEDWFNCHVVELFHGPTLSFKDFGARVMGRLLRLFQGSSSDKTIVLVATSGDTGSAVADGFSGIDGVEVVILYPANQVSEFQERQLTRKRAGVTACRVRGTFDDCQRLVKAAFSDPSLASLRLTSANSINIGRLLPQTTYYAWASRSHTQAPIFCVPSGNLGNLTAGLLAWRAGVSAAGFLAAHNANHFFPDFLSRGEAVPRASIRTLSNAMDVGAPSNFERMKHLFTDDELRHHIKGYVVSDDETLRTIADVYRDTGYIADPHTAVGLQSVRRYRAESGDAGPIVILSTAHPAKFSSSVETAIGRSVDYPEQYTKVSQSESACIDLENDLTSLARIIIASAN